jgi:hypothetical protein
MRMIKSSTAMNEMLYHLHWCFRDWIFYALQNIQNFDSCTCNKSELIVFIKQSLWTSLYIVTNTPQNSQVQSVYPIRFRQSDVLWEN